MLIFAVFFFAEVQLQRRISQICLTFWILQNIPNVFRMFLNLPGALSVASAHHLVALRCRSLSYMTYGPRMTSVSQGMAFGHRLRMAAAGRRDGSPGRSQCSTGKNVVRLSRRLPGRRGQELHGTNFGRIWHMVLRCWIMLVILDWGLPLIVLVWTRVLTCSTRLSGRLNIELCFWSLRKNFFKSVWPAKDVRRSLCAEPLDIVVKHRVANDNWELLVCVFLLAFSWKMRRG